VAAQDHDLMAFGDARQDGKPRPRVGSLSYVLM
jgi:hypothetical protein